MMGGLSAFPQARVVALDECADRAMFGAVIGPYSTSGTALPAEFAERIERTHMQRWEIEPAFEQLKTRQRGLHAAPRTYRRSTAPTSHPGLSWNGISASPR